MTTIPGDERSHLLDLPHGKDRRSLGVPDIIPTSTGAAKALADLPGCAVVHSWVSMRVPVIDVSLVDFVVRTEVNPSAEEVNTCSSSPPTSVCRRLSRIE